MNTYAELQNAIMEWLIRPDLASRVPTFIRLAEAEASRRLRTRQMVARARIMADNRYVALPSDWRKAWNIQRVADDYPLEYRAPAELDRLRYDSKERPGKYKPASFYTLFGNSLELAPAPTPEDPVEVEMIYYAKVPMLSDESQSNWLLQAHPDLYLFGALKHTATFLKEDERLPVWAEQFETALAAANAEDTDARRSGAPMSRSIGGF